MSALVVGDWRARVAEEKAALDERIVALVAFGETAAFEALPQPHKDSLTRQLRGMLMYQSALAERLALP